ncbi:unnamed protein product [Lathyrus oleraceus]
MATASLVSAALKRLEGKVALITGGASGIGEATARLFSQNGAKVVIADIQDDQGHSVCQELHKSSASYVHCDVTNEKDIENAVNTTVSKYGKLDIMFNNAGILGVNNTNILEYKLSDFQQVINVNVLGVFLGTKHAARVMIPAKRVVGLTRNTAVELGAAGVRVNCVSPYLVATPLAKKYFNLDEDECLSIYSNLKGANLLPKEVAEAALYLGSDESKYVSGHSLVIDGGFTIVNNGFCVFGQSV